VAEHADEEPVNERVLTDDDAMDLGADAGECL